MVRLQHAQPLQRVQPLQSAPRTSDSLYVRMYPQPHTRTDTLKRDLLKGKIALLKAKDPSYKAKET